MKKDPKVWEKLSSKVILDHPDLSISQDKVILPNGTEKDYILRSPTDTHSVAIIAINDKSEILVQREYSYPPNEIMWQLPGGAMNPKESIIDAAQRELAEESGLKMKSAKEIGYFYVNNRLSNRKQYIVFGSDTYPSAAKADDDEFIHSEWMSINKITKLIAQGEINNINMLAALQLWQSRSKN